MLPHLLFLLLSHYCKAHPLQLRRLFRKLVVPRKEVLLLMCTFLALGAGAQERVKITDRIIAFYFDEHHDVKLKERA